MTTVVFGPRVLNQDLKAALTSVEQSDAIATGGVTLGPDGTGTAAAPPVRAGGAGAVGDGGTEGDVELGGGVLECVVAVAPGCPGDEEQDATMQLVRASTGRRLRVLQAPNRPIPGGYRDSVLTGRRAGAMVERNGVPPAEGTVRVATSSDVRTVARLHSSAISEGFLSSLGDRFLIRLYSRILRSPHGFLLVSDGPSRPESELAPHLTGFVAGSPEVGLLYREFLLRDGLGVFLSSGVRMARALPRVVETARYGTRRDLGESDPDGAGEPETELLAMAVDDAARRQGVGTALVNSFMERARTTGSSSARVVVSAHNQSAIALYARAGFTESARLQLHAGSESLLMRATLSGVVA